MKIKKILLSLLLFTLFSSVVLPSISFAAVTESDSVQALSNGVQVVTRELQANTIEELDNELKSFGYPEDYISKMSLERKQDIISKNPVGLDIIETKEFYFDENGELKEIVPEEYSISSSTIPDADLRFRIEAMNLGRIDGRQTYTITAFWEWLTIPFFTYTDSVGLSYNDEFQSRVATNGAYKCSSAAYKGTLPPVYTNCGGRPADITFGGAYWYYDIKSSSLNDGYLQMDIETKAKNRSGSLFILLKYYHKTGLPGSIGLNVGYGSISVSAGSGYQEAGSQGSLNYK